MADTELSIRVKRIDDLVELGADLGENVSDGDNFFVSHQTNKNDDTGSYVSKSRRATLGTIKDFISKHIMDDELKGGLKNVKIEDLADGEDFMEDVTNTMQKI